MPRNYVDNAYNRSVGRVGMPVGSAVISRSSGGSSGGGSYGGGSYGGGSYGGGSSGGGSYGGGSHGGGSSLNSYSSPRTYVDNSYNRSVGRVGLEVGTAVISRSSGSSYGGDSSSSGRTYVDNSYNRSHGRVGLPVGSAVISKSSTASMGSSSSSPRTYVDNEYNRREGRVGLPVGSAVISKSSGSSASRSSSGKCYVDNPYNRRLGRVGLPLGSAPMSSTSAVSSTSNKTRTYVDNPLNRKLGRVGKPLGTAVYKPNTSQSRDYGRIMKQPDVYQPLYDFDPEDPGIPSMYENLVRKLQETVDDPQSHFECEKAIGILHRHDAAIAQSRSKTLERPKWLRGGEVIEYSDLEIGSKIGSGGFGDVFIAVWKERLQVVVKKLRVQRVQEKKKLQFQQEVKVLSSLNHPCIVQFYGACVVTPNIGIVMEFMAGGSLHDVVHVECRPLTLIQKLNLTEDILSALKYIHGEDVAHRDVKATNVLLTEDLNHCKLGDFGLALKESNTSSLSIADHSVVGTIRYSSPEILQGERLTLAGCKAADIYAASLTINELFLEEEPFEGLNQHQLRKAVIKGERPEPSNDSNHSVPRLLKVLIEQGWSERINERPDANSFFKMFQQVKLNLIDE